MAGETLGDLIATLGSIDDDEIDWQNVQQTTVLIQQTFSYEYPGPIAALRHRLMVVPPDYHDNQRLLTHKIRVSGCDVDTERSYDTFGNVILDLSLEHVEREVEFTTWAVVEREAAVDGTDTPDAIAFDQRFAEPSRLTHADDALRAVAVELRGTGLQGIELADQISHRVFEHFEYRFGVTAVTTPACGRVGGRYRGLPGLRALHAGSLPAVRIACPLRVRSRARRRGHACVGGDARPASAGRGRAARRSHRSHPRPARGPALHHGRGGPRLPRRAADVWAPSTRPTAGN